MALKKKKVKINYIDVNIIDLVLLSMSIDEIFKFNIIESIKLKINNNITNELYRLLFSKHNSYIILLGINYKIKGNLIL